MAERKALLLRMPPELHDELRRWADDEVRSLTAQLVRGLTLEQAVLGGRSTISAA